MKYGVTVNYISENAGVRNGDAIVSIDNKPVDDYYSLTRDIILDEVKSVQVKRNGQIVNVPFPKGTINSLIKNKMQFVEPRCLPVIDTVVAEVAHFTKDTLLKGDLILALNNVPVTYFDEVRKEAVKYKNQEIAITVLRNNKDTVLVKAKSDTAGRIGFNVNSQKQSGAYKQKYDLIPAFPAGVRKGWESLVMNVKNFKLLFTSEEVKASESLGSFLSIGNMFDAEWDWEVFWSMTALLSVVLAFMNILPIPALDGGHVLFTLYEMITGRKPGDKFMEYAQMVGMVLLLALMAYAIGLDFWRYLFK
jgi:regulator of sigma E protease